MVKGPGPFRASVRPAFSMHSTRFPRLSYPLMSFSSYPAMTPWRVGEAEENELADAAKGGGSRG